MTAPAERARRALEPASAGLAPARCVIQGKAREMSTSAQIHGGAQGRML
jgi:hypothetical protein